MRRLAALSILAFSLACGGDSPSTPTPPSVVGNWSLETIGGARLPYVIQQIGSDKLELMEAGVSATANGAFSATSTERTTISGKVESQSYVDPGHFTIVGTSVSFVFDADGSVVHGTLEGNTLTFNDGPLPVVYRRQ